MLASWIRDFEVQSSPVQFSPGWLPCIPAIYFHGVVFFPNISPPWDPQNHKKKDCWMLKWRELTNKIFFTVSYTYFNAQFMYYYAYYV